MTEKELKLRTWKFAVNILKLVDGLPNRRSAVIVGGQLGRCGPAVAANYRATCRGRSHKEFTARMGVVKEEADESTFWLALLLATGKSQFPNYLTRSPFSLNSAVSATFVLYLASINLLYASAKLICASLNSKYVDTPSLNLSNAMFTLSFAS